MTKVLCVCVKGRNRSKYLAKYLRGKGYFTRYGGVGNVSESKEGLVLKLISQEDVDWADVIVLARKKVRDLFDEKFSTDKPIIQLDVSGSRKRVSQEFPWFRDMSREEFKKQWTCPQLRKSIKPFLPLTR